jgi:hypothetical protein
VITAGLTPVVHPQICEHEAAHVVTAAALGIGCWWVDARTYPGAARSWRIARGYSPHAHLADDQAAPLDAATAYAAGYTWEALAGWDFDGVRGHDRVNMTRVLDPSGHEVVIRQARELLTAHAALVYELADVIACVGGRLDAVALQRWWMLAAPEGLAPGRPTTPTTGGATPQRLEAFSG